MKKQINFLLKKIKAKYKLMINRPKLHPSYYNCIENDGLTTAEHIGLDDKYMRCLIRFKEPINGIENDARSLWVSVDKKSIIGEFTYMHWYSLHLRIGLDIDIAKECIVIESPEHEKELKLAS